MLKSITAALAAASLLAIAGCRQTTVTGNEAGNAATENASALVAAGDGINGTWKADLSTVQMDQKPDEYLIKDGQYSCKTCIPPIAIAADGAFHPINAPYADSYAVNVVDDHNVTRTSKKGGRQTGESRLSVSADGNTLTGEFTDSSTPNAPPTKGKYTETRVGPAPAGAHAISGSWKPAKLENFNQEALTFTFNADGDTFHMSSPSGVSYDAKLDGTDAPIKGDIAGTTASVKKVGDSVYEETDKRDGKVISVTTMTVDADGKLNVVSVDKRNGSTTKYVATKH
jgi:hypothetical protein